MYMYVGLPQLMQNAEPNQLHIWYTGSRQYVDNPYRYSQVIGQGQGHFDFVVGGRGISHGRRNRGGHRGNVPPQ